ncbi:hypothetical protein SSAG_02725 [Streptomyces sp. Mg1]|nr:hypothetical protein SSAG_02725 [Streptomyces sp. Mg1]
MRPAGGHPRGCGEQPEPVGVTEGVRGSSPRVRGAVRVGLLLLQVEGVIPAGAGSSL